MAAWMLTTACGNFIVMASASANWPKNDVAKVDKRRIFFSSLAFLYFFFFVLFFLGAVAMSSLALKMLYDVACY